MKQIRIFLAIVLTVTLFYSCMSTSKERPTDITPDASTDSEEPASNEEKDAGKDDKRETVRSDERAPEMELMLSEEISSSDLSVSSPAPGIPAYKAAAGASAYPAGDAPTQSGLKAGYADDNRQFGYFTGFLEDYRSDVVPLALNVDERIILKLSDVNGKSVQGADVVISAEGKTVKGKTLADGSYQINPSELFEPKNNKEGTITVSVTGGDSMPGFGKKLEINRYGERSVYIKTDGARKVASPVPLDIVFVMDTTGSMGEEIARLKNTIQIIHMNLNSMAVTADIRFGMVLYKDREDDYVTEIIPLTSDLESFQSSLDQVQAYGGGDTPEDLEAALGDLINSMEWDPEAVKLSYVITDAPPHLDYQSSYTCSDAARDARKAGIKIFGIGTGGLDLQGEYILRQIAQYTSARYIFLTYGNESGESEGGTPGSVSHHTGSNWNADKLESIIIRFTREELSWLSDKPLTDDDSWFEAGNIPEEETSETLSKLFSQAVDQLIDYSTISITDKTLLAVLPFSSDESLSADAEYFNEHLVLAAGKNDRIKLAERKDIAQLLNEIEFQNLGITDDDTVSEIGEFLNADVLLIGNLFRKDGQYELFLKFIRVETAEILSVTRALIAPELGL